MSLGEFMNDQSLGGSWADDDFDVNSIEIPLNESPRYTPFNGGPGRFNTRERGSSYNDYGNKMRGGSSYDRGFEPRDSHYGGFDDHDYSYERRNSGPRLSDLPSVPIAKLSNLPEVATQKLVQNLFESRFMKFEKIKVLVDPNPPQPRFSKFHHEEEQQKKCAYVQLISPQDLLKVLKWNDIFMERLRVEVSIAEFEDFQNVQKYNKELGFDESAEEERLNKKLEEEANKANHWRQEVKYGAAAEGRGTYGGRRYSSGRRFSSNSDGEGMDASKCPYLAGRGFKGPIKGMKAPHPLPAIGGAPIVKEKHDHKPREQVLRNTERQPEKVQKILPKPKPQSKKANPFGIAKPVDPKKQLEVEKEIEKMSINSTTFSTEKLNNQKIQAEKNIQETHEKKESAKSPQDLNKHKEVKQVADVEEQLPQHRTRRVSIIRRNSNAKVKSDNAPKVVSRDVAVHESISVQLERHVNRGRNRRRESERRVSPVKASKSGSSSKHTVKHTEQKRATPETTLKSSRNHKSHHRESEWSNKGKKLSGSTASESIQKGKFTNGAKGIDGRKQPESRKKKVNREADGKKRNIHERSNQTKVNDQVSSSKAEKKYFDTAKFQFDASSKSRSSEPQSLQLKSGFERRKTKQDQRGKKSTRKVNEQKKLIGNSRSMETEKGSTESRSLEDGVDAKNTERGATNSRRRSFSRRRGNGRGWRRRGKGEFNQEKYHKNYTYVRGPRESEKKFEAKKSDDRNGNDAEEKVTKKAEPKSAPKSEPKSEQKPGIDNKSKK